jgi:uncharacterized protein with GYD domain
MAKFVMFFSYTSETWARLVNNPEDRVTVARHVVESVGGTLESLYWMLGDRDGLAIVDARDSVSAAAISLAVTSSGAFKHNETRELLTQDQLASALNRARDLTAAFQPPGQGG